MDTIRIGFFIGELLKLLCCATDVGNAFLYGLSREKVYLIAGKEFGEGLLGRLMLVVKGLYGLKTSAARFQEHLADILRSLGFSPSKPDSNFWYRDCGDHYEYCACYVDDLLIWSKDPMKIVKQLETVYELKGTGSPEYFLGADVQVLDEHWQNEGVGLGISAKTYIEQIVPKLFNVTLRGIKTPMDENYHPEN